MRGNVLEKTSAVRSRTFLIAGAGLGGLTAAACLLKKGHDVQVFEQSPVLGEVGAGIQISANAARVFRYLGIEDEVAEAGFAPAAYRFRTFDTGEVLQTIELGERYRMLHGTRYVTIHRADLHAILAGAVRALKPDAISTGARAIRYEEDEDVAILHLDGQRPAHGDVVIGADGIKSVIREQILGRSEAEYTGDAAWRVIVPMEDLPEEFRGDCTDIWVGPGRHAVTYPLRQGKLMNFVGAVEYEAWDDESWTTPHPWSELRDDFSGWNPMVTAIVDVAPRRECYRWALKNRKPVKQWSTKRATLLGDAAHPTLPYMAQGAAMAIEDAAVLSRAFEQEDDIAAALDLYQRNRIERTSRVVRESSENRRMFHMSDMDELRAAFAKRDINAERSKWLFSYDPMTVHLT
jgi:salicylate hydroxylase